MGWKELSPFLKRFKQINPPEKAIKDVCVDAIYQIVGIRLIPHEIRINNNKIIIRANHTIKNEIFIYRMKILSVINQTLAGKNINDIT